MNRMRRTWVAACLVTLGTAAAACGGGAAFAPRSSGEAAAPPPSAPGAEGSYNGPGGYPQQGQPSAQQGYDAKDDSSAAEAEATSPSPPPASPGAGALGDLRSSPAPTSKSAAPRDEGPSRREVAPEPVNRPGLGTEWGETRFSQITTTPFLRADPQTPFATLGLFYNDEEGARAMASSSGFQRMSTGQFRVANGVVTVGLRDERGGFLSGFVAGGRDYVIGEAGRRYSIVIRNQSPGRFECVVSVDGLDVLDGKAGAFSKRGYLLDPNGELEIDGFRQSADAVAAFRFGSVRGSYANQKHGETRNVGVIGLALFHERGTNPAQWTQEEINRRNDANPFPGQFATPPGSR